MLNLRKTGRIKTIKEYYTWNGKTHSEESKMKISKSMKGNGNGKGSSNSQFGKRWITNEIENKKINKEDLIPEGWILGRVMK